MYVSALLEVHQKYSAMVTSSFGDDAGFIQALDKVWCNYFYLLCISLCFSNAAQFILVATHILCLVS